MKTTVNHEQTSKSKGSHTPAPKGKHKPADETPTSTPDICVENFIADGDTIKFQNIPTAGVTITQVSGNPNPTFPFEADGTNSKGLLYVTVATGGSVTISVPSLGTYPYTVSCTCPGDEGGHSVTVNS
jgi:hypothetical protein